MSYFTQPIRVMLVAVIAVGFVAGLSSLSLVRAERVRPDRSVYSCNSGRACVEGSSTGGSTWGVYGVGTTNDGVHGVTNSTNGYSGTSGISTGKTGTGHGVYGRSSNGAGVFGASSSDAGVEGNDTGPGGAGVAGIQLGTSKNSGTGVYAESADTTGIFGALKAAANSANTDIFIGFNAVTNGQCTIDFNADLVCSGGSDFKNVRTRHANADGQHVLAYAAESATATIDDVGTARMVGGVANVRIDPAFASVTDHKWYYVFITPLGDTRGLYVSTKSTSAFQVRETEHGRSTLEFDYRIVAHPFDAKNDRLPLAPALRPLRVMHPAH